MSRRDTPGRIGLALFTLLAILPIAFSIGYAAAYSTGLTGLLSEGFTWKHWRVLIDSSEIWTSFGLSVYIAGVSVLLTVGLSLLIALNLRKALSRGALSYVMYLPLAIPATVAAFLVFQLLSGGGFLSRIFMAAGLIEGIVDFPDLIHDAAGIGIIVAQTGLAVPFFAILFHEIYSSEKIDRLSHLARTLGASRMQVLFRVKLPVLIQRATMNIALLFIIVLGSYEIPLLLGRQSPQMISVLTLRKYQLFDIEQKPEAFIVALLYTALVLIIMIIVFKRRGGQYAV